jgi:hypothetical protein
VLAHGCTHKVCSASTRCFHRGCEVQKEYGSERLAAIQLHISIREVRSHRRQRSMCSALEPTALDITQRCAAKHGFHSSACVPLHASVAGVCAQRCNSAVKYSRHLCCLQPHVVVATDKARQRIVVALLHASTRSVALQRCKNRVDDSVRVVAADVRPRQPLDDSAAAALLHARVRTMHMHRSQHRVAKARQPRRAHFVADDAQHRECAKTLALHADVRSMRLHRTQHSLNGVQAAAAACMKPAAGAAAAHHLRL